MTSERDDSVSNAEGSVSNAEEETLADAPPRDGLGEVIRTGGEIDPIEAQVAMQRVRSRLQVSKQEDPVRIGRHLVVRRIAEGAFGVVYEAYDPELERKLAVKVLRGGAAEGSIASSGSLLDEARNLAQVSHPHVVSVFDVGILPAQPGEAAAIYLAMEMVEGQSLHEWFAAGPHPWREVVERLRAAGEGLAAAHQAGVVHRDFKPANVLIGSDGRLRVADFGLAVAATGSTGTHQGPVAESASELRSGTPAYMSPEQHGGAPCDARTDIYAFCVSLYEGVYGQRPFAGSSWTELQAAKQTGEARFVGKRIPGWLRQLIARGLGPRPEDRFATMRELLDVLDRRLSKRRRRVGIAAGLVVVALGAGYAFATAGTGGREVCLEASAATMADVWGDSVAGRIEAAFESTGLPYATSAWKSSRERLDGYAESWRALDAEVCEARSFLERNAPALLRQRETCLASRLGDLASLVSLLGEADRDTVQRSVAAAYGLPDPAACSDVSAAGDAPPDPRLQEEIDRLGLAIARLRSLRLFGKYDQAKPLAVEVVAMADAIEDPTAAAEALYEAGRTQEAAGDAKEAEVLLQRAARRAEAGDRPRLVAQIKSHLVWVVGHVLGRHDQGKVWAKNADAAIARVDTAGGDTRKLEAQYMNSLGAIHFSKGDFDAALAVYEKAHALWEEVHGSDHPTVIRAINNMGSIHFSKGQMAEARKLFEQVLAVRTKRLGADHPEVAITLSNLGAVDMELGDYEKSLEESKRVLEIRERTLDPKHPHMARGHHQLAVVLGRLGDFEAARSHHETALGILRESLGEDHPEVAASLNSLGAVLERSNRFEEAAEHYRQALALIEKRLGGDHPSAMLVLLNLGDLRRRMGDAKGAVGLHRRALAIAEKIAPDHPRATHALTTLGRDYLALGQPEKALEVLERSHDLRRTSEVDSSRAAENDMAMGQALWELGRDRKQAHALVAAAEKIWRDDTGMAQEHEDARAWLATHPPR
jgi:serine/threonine protein kinase/Flp pilus assembly protein TadD